MAYIVEYTLADWILAGWTMTDLAEKAKAEGWTAEQVIEWCIDHADDAEREAEVRDLPGYEDMVERLTEEMETTY